MSNITQLKDKDGNNIYPISSDKLILDEQGRSIGERLTNHLENHPKGFSGDYNDLTNKPTIPAKLSQLSNDVGYITSADLDTSQNHVHINMDVLNGITASKVNEWNNKSTFSGNYKDLTNKPIIPTKVSELTNDSRYLTSIPSEYVTETELATKGYLTEHQDISHLANKSDLHTHTNKTVLDGITSAKVTEWNNKSTFSGNYNDLTNKPTIPSIAGLATETYVRDKVASLVGTAPETLDTLNELAQALGNDPNFATTISNKLGEKASTTYVNAELAKKANSSHTHSNYIQYEVLSGTVVVPTVSILEEE